MSRIRWRKWTLFWLFVGSFAYILLRAMEDKKSSATLHRRENVNRNNFLHGKLTPAENSYYNSPRTTTKAPNSVEIERLRKREQKLLSALSDSTENENTLRTRIRELSVQLGLVNNHAKVVTTPSRTSVLPTVFVVTPTFSRFVQKAELTRVSQALKGIRKLHWIVVEDSKFKTELVERFLMISGLNFTHLNVRTPEILQRHKNEFRRTKPRGVFQRNVAITWLREHVNPSTTPGVVYFADDDNTYSSRIFDEIRWIQGVGVWPVAFTGAARWAGPVCKGGKVIRFHTNWGHFRPFPIDMAGFAINIKKLIIDFPRAVFVAKIQPGMLESSLLTQITSIEELEPIADNCSKVYVWHTRTEQPRDSILGEQKLIRDGHPSNPDVET